MNPAVMYKQNTAITTTLDSDSDILARDSDYGQDPNNSLSNAYDIISKAHNIPADNVKQLISLIGKFKWNTNVNVLGDIIYQLMYQNKAKEKPTLEASNETIASFVSLLCLDKDGHFMSKETLKTSLQSGKTYKRPKTGSNKKVNVRNLLL
jgi:hypothetical protein